MVYGRYYSHYYADYFADMIDVELTGVGKYEKERMDEQAAGVDPVTGQVGG